MFGVRFVRIVYRMMERMGFPIVAIVFRFLSWMILSGVGCWRYMCAMRQTKTPQSLLLGCVKGCRVVQVSSVE